MAQHCQKKDTSGISVLPQHCASGADQVIADRRNWWLLSLPAFHRDIFPKGYLLSSNCGPFPALHLSHSARFDQ